jgi:hypothetical protein
VISGMEMSIVLTVVGITCLAGGVVHSAIVLID